MCCLVPLHHVQELAKVKQQFLSEMSHEIRSPLCGIVGISELLLDCDLDQTQHEYVQTIVSCGNSLLVIINDILDFSKIESGKLVLENIVFNVRTQVSHSTLSPPGFVRVSVGISFCFCFGHLTFRQPSELFCYKS